MKSNFHFKTCLWVLVGCLLSSFSAFSQTQPHDSIMMIAAPKETVSGSVLVTDDKGKASWEQPGYTSSDSSFTINNEHKLVVEDDAHVKGILRIGKNSVYLGAFLPVGITNPDITDYEDVILTDGPHDLQISPNPGRYQTSIDGGFGYLRGRPIAKTLINPDGGQVGIGTRTPDITSQLDVNGKIKTLSFQLKGNAVGKILSGDADGNALWADPSTFGIGNFWYKRNNTVGTPSWVAIGQDNADALSQLDIKTSNGDKVLMGNGGDAAISFLPLSRGTDSWFHMHHTHSNTLQISDGGAPGDHPLFIVRNNGKVTLGTEEQTLGVGLDVRAGEGKIAANALYFTPSSNAPDNLPYARLIENWGIRFASPDNRWVFSTSNSFLAGYESQGKDWGSGNIFASGGIGVGTTDLNGSKLAVNGKLTATTFQMPTGAKINNVLSCDQYGNAFWRDPIDLNWTAGSSALYYQGNVSIGMACNDGYKLQVNGAVRFRKIRVDASGWCDSVFSQKFQLPDLTSVEAFVKENKHLDGIPTEKEVLTEGYDMSGFDAAMLGKVEQLYLYVIEQQKQLKSQQALIEELRKRIDEK